MGQAARALGVRKHDYHAVGLNPLIRNAAHALAIDERRKPFQPTLFERGNWTGALDQAWFAGVHTDIGGGYEEDSLANHTLHWMAELAGQRGLALDAEYLEPFGSNAQAAMHDSMSAMYRVAGPYERPIGAQPDTEETVHPSALDRLNAKVNNYQPPNLTRYVARR